MHNFYQGKRLGKKKISFHFLFNDLPLSSSKLAFYLFADDTNIYYEAESLDRLQIVVKKELKK